MRHFSACIGSRFPSQSREGALRLEVEGQALLRLGMASGIIESNRAQSTSSMLCECKVQVNDEMNGEKRFNDSQWCKWCAVHPAVQAELQGGAPELAV